MYLITRIIGSSPLESLFNEEYQQEWKWLLKQPRVLAYLGKEAPIEILQTLITNEWVSNEAIATLSEFILSDRSLEHVKILCPSHRLLTRYERLSLITRSDKEELFNYFKLDYKTLPSSQTVTACLRWQCRHDKKLFAANLVSPYCYSSDWINNLDDSIIFGNEDYFINIFSQYMSAVPRDISWERYISCARTEGMIKVLRYLVPILMPQGLSFSYISYKNLSSECIQAAMELGWRYHNVHLDLPFVPKRSEHIKCVQLVLAMK